jgi:hypothetical protein
VFDPEDFKDVQRACPPPSSSSPAPTVELIDVRDYIHNFTGYKEVSQMNITSEHRVTVNHWVDGRMRAVQLLTPEGVNQMLRTRAGKIEEASKCQKLTAQESANRAKAFRIMFMYVQDWRAREMQFIIGADEPIAEPSPAVHTTQVEMTEDQEHQYTLRYRAILQQVSVRYKAKRKELKKKHRLPYVPYEDLMTILTEVQGATTLMDRWIATNGDRFGGIRQRERNQQDFCTFFESIHMNFSADDAAIPG